MSKELSARPLHLMAHAYSSLSYADFQKPESVCLLLQYLLQSCSRGGRGDSGGHVLRETTSRGHLRLRT